MINMQVITEIKTSYVEGKDSLRELATKHGISHRALRNRCVRGKWAQERGQFEAEMRQATNSRMREVAEDRASEFVERMADDCFRTMDHVVEMEMPDSLQDLNVRESVMTKLNHRARLTLQLDQPSQTTQVLGVNIVAASQGRLLVEAMTAIKVDTGDPDQT